MPLAPPFDSVTAKAVGRTGGIKSGEARRLKRDEAAHIAGSLDDEPRKRRILGEIDATLDELRNCEPDMRVKLTNALDKLWNLVYPRAGVTKPQRSGQRRTAPSVEPAPQAPQTGPGQPPV